MFKITKIFRLWIVHKSICLQHREFDILFKTNYIPFINSIIVHKSTFLQLPKFATRTWIRAKISIHHVHEIQV